MLFERSEVEHADRAVTDFVRSSPVDRDLSRMRRLLAAALCVLGLGGFAWFAARFLSDRTPTYASMEEHFKYGSIGSEPGGSLSAAVGGMLPPLDVFRVLPKICPEKLPGGYASLGVVYEPGHALPIGFSTRHRLGFEQVGINCALCHTGTYRDTPQGARHVVSGMPANRLEVQRLFRFVVDCMLDERFTATNLFGHFAAAGIDVSPVDALLYRTQVVPRLRETGLEFRGRLAQLLDGSLLEWGPGRVDTFNPYKALQFNWRISELPKSELTGAANYPPLWNQKPREGMLLHWDGNNSSVDERNLSAALGAGVTPVTADHAAIERVRDWIWTLPPPKYPYAIDAALAARGAEIYAGACTACHADHRFREGVSTGEHLGKVTSLEDIGTDPQRLLAYTHTFAANQNTLYPDSAYRFKRFRKTDGYANRPLDGVWLRAPYLHNGSVPTLRDLLTPPEARPRVFFRGYDVYDSARVGFVSDRAIEQNRPFFRFDTSLPGNHNTGHVYGTDLSDTEKDALIEYLKTF